MRINTLLCVLALLCLQVSVFAQRNCGSMDVLEQQILNDPERSDKLKAIEQHTEDYINSPAKSVNGIITIPVVFHVVYRTSTENISDAQIASQMQVLNDDFRRMNSDVDNTWPQAADTQIEFCLASFDPSGNPTTGITRTYTSVISFGNNDSVKSSTTGGVNPWPTSDYLNVWVCNIGGGILGYAQFPGGNPATDGVVNDYRYTGTIGTATAPFDLGRTLTHEVGHYLNLRHIWGDGNCNVDDFVSDTPVSDAANYSCALGHSSCGSDDMVQNYMDYSNDACMNLFTNGQKDRMRALFDTGGARASLLASSACGAVPPTSTCSDGILNGQETGLDCGGPDCAPCPCLGTLVTVSITLDNYQQETSWSIIDANGLTVAFIDYYDPEIYPDGTTVDTEVCLPAGCYDFQIDDTYGDGICCGYGNGSYVVTREGAILASGGEFAHSETTNFCLGGAGPTATCDDGILNGNEIGVDCGGPDCAPCDTGDCQTLTIDANNFDIGWGIWNDGGSDCRRSSYDAAYANSGNYCIRLRDNTSSSVMTTDNLNLANFEEVTVDFSYIGRSMENGEDFWLQISTNGGSSYQTLTSYTQGTDFMNLIRENETVVIPGPFSNTTRFRFRCDASGNSDWIYIDDVTIFGCANNSRVGSDPFPILEVETIEVENTQINETDILDFIETGISEVNLFPNPTKDNLNVAYQIGEAAEVYMTVVDLSGKVILQQASQVEAGAQQIELNVSNLNAGIYLLQIVTKDSRIIEKFVVTE